MPRSEPGSNYAGASNAYLGRIVFLEIPDEATVILNPTDYATITPLGLVLQPLMKEIGFNVKMPAIDWSTVVSNFGTPETFALATAWYSHFEGPDPTNDHLISGTLSWPVQDEEFVELQLRYAQEPDPAVRMEVLREIQRQRYEKVPKVMLGQFFPMTPTTAALKNFHVRPLPLFINAWLER